MKIVFFGTSEFAVNSLKKLASSDFSVTAVITRPDRKRGRSLKVSAPPVKIEAERSGIPVYQPRDINEREFIGKLKSFTADLFIVVAFGTILSKDIIDIPKVCALNAHASLLPKYRGAAPSNWAIINGEKETGVTIIRINEKMDAGDVLLQKRLAIKPEYTSEILDSKLAGIAADLLLEAVELVRKGEARFIPQKGENATFAPKLTKNDGKIDWSMNTKTIINRVRGLKPWPGTYSLLEGHIFKIISVKGLYSDSFLRFSPGEVITADEAKGLIIRTGNGGVGISKLQLEGKKAMPVELFLRGRNVKIGTKLGR